MSDPQTNDDFASPAEFAALMTRLSGRLHAKNRIWMGESGYAFRVAQLLQAIGHDFQAAMADGAADAAFGTGYGRGSLTTDAAEVDELLARLRARMVPRGP